MAMRPGHHWVQTDPVSVWEGGQGLVMQLSCSSHALVCLCACSPAETTGKQVGARGKQVGVREKGKSCCQLALPDDNRLTRLKPFDHLNQ